MKKKILLAEEDRKALIFFKELFDRYQDLYIIVEAIPGEEVMEKYIECSPDLVLMDIMMQRTSGLLAAKSILEYDENAKIIMLTSIGLQKIVQEALKIGVKGYLLKPLEEQKVLKVLEIYLSEMVETDLA